MQTFTGLHSHQHRQRHQNFPPQTYNDLSRADIQALVHFLTEPSPTSHTKRKDAFDGSLAKLPSHLRSKMPLLNTFCAHHRRLSPMPLINLRKALLTTAERELMTKWLPLQASGRLHPEVVVTVKPLEVYIHDAGRSKCAACDLSEMTSNVGVATALGSIIIARLKPSDWKRSKRILWMEACIKAGCKHDEADGVLQRMWEVGTQLHDVRHQLRSKHEDRPYIDGYQAQHSAGLPKVVAQDEAQSLTERASHETSLPLRLSEDSTAVEDADRTVPGTPRAVFEVPKQPMVQGGRRNVFDDAFQEVDVRDLFSVTLAPSSIYSRTMTQTTLPLRQAHSSGWAKHDTLHDDGELVATYRRSAYPADEMRQSLQMVNETAAEPSTPRQRQLSLRDFPRHKLAPITMPKSKFGDNVFADPPMTSGLWRRRVDSKAPVLRMGRNGEVNGPFDSVSVVNLFEEAEQKNPGGWI